MKLTERQFKRIWLSLPIVLLTIYLAFYIAAQQVPPGPLSRQYMRDMAFQVRFDPVASSEPAVTDLIAGFLRVVDLISGGGEYGVPDAQLLCFGIPILFLGWTVVAKALFMPEYNP